MADWQERQLAEVESLQAIYFEDGAVVVDEVALDSLRRGEGPNPAVPLSLSVRLPGEMRLAAVLPAGYPEEGSEGPVIWLEPDGSGGCSSLLEDEEMAGRLQALASSIAASGEECLLQVLQLASDLINDHLEEMATAEEVVTDPYEDEAVALALFQEELRGLQQSERSRARASRTPILGRRAMFSHHIAASSKRQAIREWADQLHLGCLAKVGWPGIIIAEGEEEDIQTYVNALSRLRWKHFVVRGEQIVQGKPGQTVDELRLLPRGAEEFGPDAMSELATRCRQLGVEDLFFASMKMYSGSKAEKKGRDEEPEAKTASRGGRKR